MENIKSDGLNETEDKRVEIKQKLRQYYDGRIVRKDLTKSIREGANVPVYVLEYLLGQYCNSDDEEIIEEGVENVKRILRDNYVRPDEAQKILSLLRERGSYTVIDRITVVLNTKEDRYEATFSNLGVKGIPIHPDYVKDYDRLLCGGIWCILQMEYEFIEEDKKNTQPVRIRKLTPIQMPHVDMDEVKNKLQMLEQAMQAASQQMYQQQAQQNADAGNASSNGGKDDFVDAEFEEKK